MSSGLCRLCEYESLKKKSSSCDKLDHLMPSGLCYLCDDKSRKKRCSSCDELEHLMPNGPCHSCDIEKCPSYIVDIIIR